MAPQPVEAHNRLSTTTPLTEILAEFRLGLEADMVTTIAPEIAATRKPSQIVEMNLDPITRIVGSLGLYTKIDL